MSETPHRYTAELAQQIELAWQDRWQEEGTFHAPNPAGPWAEPEKVAGREKLLVLDMFPYPSGAGLHVGHPLGYIATDVFARYHRMTGKNVLHCLGYDAFGLPAEQYAVQTGQHPRKTTEDNMVVMKRQLRRLGLGHDDRRTIATIDPDYYQLDAVDLPADLQLLVRPGGRAPGRRHGAGPARSPSWSRSSRAGGRGPTPDGRGLGGAERRPSSPRSSTSTGWPTPPRRRSTGAPGLGTVLSNEEVTNDGRSERGNFPVFKTQPAPVDDADHRVRRPAGRRPRPRRLAREGQGHAAQLDRAQPGRAGRLPRGRARTPPIEVFTTRPDTLFGATFMVLAPEHPLVDEHRPAGRLADGTKPAWTGGAATPEAAVAAYRLAASRKSDVERQTEGKDKTGVFTGAFATNPVNGDADPGLRRRLRADGLRHRRDHGGAGQDERDWDFATQFELPIVRTVQPAEGHPEDEAFTGEGPAINSANDECRLDGLGVAEAKATIIDWLAGQGPRRGDGQLQAARLAVQPAALLGRAVPDRLRRGRRQPRACPTRCCPSSCRTSRTTRPRPSSPTTPAASPSRRWAGSQEWVDVELDLGDGRGRAQVPPRDQHDAQLGRVLLVLPALPRPGQRRGASSTPANEAYWMGPHADAGRRRARGRRATPAASTSTSAASSTPCCTCSTPASGTRCCTTWAT